jgi:hypothetical protein
MEKYVKSRKNKDIWGNNTFHYVWDIDVSKIRNEILELLLTEDVGCPLKHNKMGILPHYIDHRFGYADDIPDHLKSFY